MNQTVDFKVRGQSKKFVRIFKVRGQSKKFVRIFTLTPTIYILY